MSIWDILGASVGISTRTPYCSAVCLCLNNSLTHYEAQTSKRTSAKAAEELEKNYK